MTLLIVTEVRPNGERLAAMLNAHDTSVDTIRIACIEEADVQARYVDAIVIVHDAYPPGNIREFVLRVRDLAPRVPVVVYAAPREEAGELLDLVGNGIDGYCLTDQPVDDLCETIRAVQRGETILDARVAMQLVEKLRDLRTYLELCGYEIDPVVEPLTRREREVLALVEQGMSNKEIADHLFIEIGTVKNHVHNILNKLGARDRDQAVRHFHTHFMPS